MDLETLLRRLVPVLGEPEVERLRTQLHLAEPRTGRVLEVLLRQRLAAATGLSPDGGDVVLDPIPADRAHGDYGLGDVLHGRRPQHGFALRAGELLQHLAIFGRSGAGKTNAAFLLLSELTRQRIPFLVFDWKKNYRDLLRLPAFADVVVYTVGRDDAPFLFNPLIPPAGTPPREWLKKLTEIMQHAYFLGEGVAFVLQEALDALYRRFGVYDRAETYPTLRDLQGILLERPVKGREAAWMESTRRAVGVLCFGAMDHVLNSGAHLPVEWLLASPAVLELDALTNSDKTFLIEALLLWIHHHRMNEAGRETLKHVLLVEEAHHVLLKKKQELTGAEAVTDVILREIREFGEGIVLLDQLPSLISKPALENTFTTIAMNLKEKGDVMAASKAMLLESDEARLLGRLPVGEGVVKLQGRWVRPFAVRFPHFAIEKGVVADAEAHDRFLAGLDVEAAARMMRGMADTALRQLGGVTDVPTKEPAASRLPDEAEAVLVDIRDHPFSPVTERYRRLGLSAKVGTRTVRLLGDAGLVTAVKVPIPGSQLMLLDLSPAARRRLGLQVQGPREGGLEHRYWVEQVVRSAEAAGLSAAREVPVGEGRTTDVLIEAEGRQCAVEVETGESDWRANVQKCKNAGLGRTIVLATRPRVRTRIAAATAEAIVLGPSDLDSRLAEAAAGEPHSGGTP